MIGIKSKIKNSVLSVLMSYSSLFFSDNIFLASILVVVTFLDLFMGLSGIVSVILANVFAYVLGLNRNSIYKGQYGFNALLVGLGLALYFDPNIPFFLLLGVTTLMTLFFTVICEGVIGKYRLPFLSIPFLLSTWVVTLATRSFASLKISERGIYVLNELYKLGGDNLLTAYHWWNAIPIPEPLRVYFVSLGAIFFQYNVLAGLLICIGILYYSRIAFSLSLIGFFIAYYFYHYVGIEISGLTYSYIGFNYILTAIAIGGFFIIPSISSYVWVVILVPMVTVITISTTKLFELYQLSVYSLPFNIIVISFLYVLKNRIFKNKFLTEVSIQQNQPEKNLYAYKNSTVRFNDMYNYFPIKLPFWGEWTVSQGHDGEYTHKQEWRHAWDFVITDEFKKYHHNDGTLTDDHYCYGKIILAPAAGIVELIVDTIPDNAINDVNLNENWGNTIIIKHSDYLYSKLCHLKPGSFKVGIGEYVYQGQQLAQCGNSGRSPFPHLHFQLQATPFIESPSLDYPINHFINVKNGGFELLSYKRPKQNDVVSNIATSQLIKKAFHFIPGETFMFKISDGKFDYKNEWEVVVDIYNNSYLYCRTTDSKAYFMNDGDLHYFKHFEGDTESLLYFFFLGAYKVQMGYYKHLELEDNLPPNLIYGKVLLFFQDFIAPFHIFLKGTFTSEFGSIDNELSPSEIVLNTTIKANYKSPKNRMLSVSISVLKTGINGIDIISGTKKIKAQCIVR